jgi:hypothetical protein
MTLVISGVLFAAALPPVAWGSFAPFASFAVNFLRAVRTRRRLHPLAPGRDS